MSKDEHDLRKIRCRMLGHEVNFSYCRQGSGDLPCRKIFDCWFEHFDIEQFMRTHFSEEEIQKILTPPQPKMVSLLEMIRRAQQNSEQAKEK